LDGPLAQESRLRERHTEEQRHLEFAQGRYESALDNLERVEALGWRERRRELPRARERVERQRQELDLMRSRVERLEPLRDDARRESAAIRQVLAEREDQALIAARLSPPSYIVKELGERPREPAKVKAWNQGVKTIESYRQEHGVTDGQGAFGREPRSNSQKVAREAAQRRVREAQLRLGRERQLAQAKRIKQSINRGFSIGR
jgi:hypothetical protein